MREIKFRGKRKDAEEWVYGDLIQAQDGRKFIWNRKYIDDLFDDIIEVVPETVGQYTGLKDKNGKEIYEGDIIKHISEAIAEVYWDEAILTFRFRNPRTKGMIVLFVYELKDCEVVGNIFGNKEFRN